MTDTATQERIAGLIKTSENIRAIGMIEWGKLHADMAALFGPISPPTWRMRLEWRVDRIREAWGVLWS